LTTQCSSCHIPQRRNSRSFTVSAGIFSSQDRCTAGHEFWGASTEDRSSHCHKVPKASNDIQKPEKQQLTKLHWQQ
jgi:hypothetical protein